VLQFTSIIERNRLPLREGIANSDLQLILFLFSKFTRSVKCFIGYPIVENRIYLQRWSLSIDLIDQRLSRESSMSQDSQEIYSHFVEPQVSLPRSDKPTNCP